MSTNATESTLCPETLEFHIGAFYQVLIIGLLIGYLTIGILCIRDLLAYRKSQTKLELDLKVTIYSMTIFSDFARVIWLLDPHQNSKPFGVDIFGDVFSAILLKVGQIVLISALLLLILIWRQLVCCLTSFYYES